MTVWRFASVVSFALLVFLPASASAVDLNQWVQGLKLNLYVTERLEYETNIFQVPSHSEDDLISRTSPGFLLTYDRGPLAFNAGYRAEVMKFLNNTNEDNVHHFGTVALGLNFSRVKLQHQQTFTLTSDPPTSRQTGRIDSTTINIPTEIEFALTPRFGLGATYQFTHVQFEKSAEQMNRDTHLFGTYAAWKFLPKADLRIGYQYGYSEFDNVQGFTDRDVRHHIASLQVKGDLTPKLSSTFRLGYEIRETDDQARLGNDSTVFLGGDTTYRPTERTTIILATSRTFENSIFGLTGNSVMYESTRIGLSAQQLFGTKVRVNGRITGIFDDDRRKEITITTIGQRPKYRVDTTWIWGGGVDYDIQKWLSIGAEYTHTQRDSTFDEFNYADDKFTAKLTLQF